MANTEKPSFPRPEVDEDLVLTLSELRAIEPEWRAFLEKDVLGANIFNDPVYIDQQLESQSGTTPWVIVLRRNGRIRCIAPFFLQHTRRKIQLSVFTLATLSARMLNLFGASFIVAADEDHRQYMAKVLDVLWRHRGQFDLVFLQDLDVASDLWESCRSMCSRGRPFRQFPASSRIDAAHTIVFPSTHDDFMKSLSYETRRRLRRFTRKLCSQEHARLELITLPEQVPTFLAQLDEIYRDCWQAKHYGYHPRNTQSRIRFLQGMAERGWLRSYLLVNDHLPFAFALGYQYDRVWYFEETGYAQTWAHYGPGTVLMHMFIEDLYRAESPRLLDFRSGSQDYKVSFSNVRNEVISVYLAPWSLWRAILALQNALFAAERLARSIVVRLKLDRPLRKLLARAGANVGRNTQ